VKVLLASRRSSLVTIGGDTIQVRSLARELTKLGCEVQISFDGKISPDNFDLVHLFNIDRPQDIFQLALRAKRKEIPVVLTPIFVDYREFDIRGRSRLVGGIFRVIGAGRAANAKVLARALRNGEFHRGTLKALFPGVYSLQKAILSEVGFFLPNSISEMKRFCRYFDLDMDAVPWEKVVNGVDTELFRLKPDRPKREGVLCVARIEGIKNQLNLVRAMDKLPWPMTLVGAPAPNHRQYLSRVLKAAGDNVNYMGPVLQTELPFLYQRAKVHVLPSWFETTGLTSLEAVMMGCNIVITGKGDTREYFRDDAFYCEPDDVDSIRDAIQKAYDAPVNPEFRERLLNTCTWKKAAEKTLAVYRRILDEY